MSGDREPDDATGAFDADAWFRSQFGGDTPVPPVEPPVEPAPAVSPPPVVPPPPPQPPLAVPPASAPPPSSVPVPLPPPLMEPRLPQPVDPVHVDFAAVVEPEPTQPAEIVPPAPIGDAATELLREPEQGGALDELFGEQSFQEYDDTLIAAAPRTTRRGSRGSASGAGDGGGGGGDGDGTTTGEGRDGARLSRTQAVLLWVAGSLAAVLALVAVFVIGTRIPMLLGPAPGAEPITTASPTPSASAGLAERPVGPVAPGDYRWDELAGGECLEPFVDAWQEKYTVVDCAEPHGGQLVLRAEVPLIEGELEAGPYPGEEPLAELTLQLCSSAGVLDLAVAGAFTDIVVQAAFPVSAEAWERGERDYFCFASRSSGEALTSSLAGSGPAPSPSPSP